MSSAENIIYKVDLSRNAGHYLERLDRPTQSRIVSALRNLAIDPYAEAVDCKPLAGRLGEYRLRVGKYRVIYSIDDGILLISVIDIGSRGDVYKK
jgi:mRNA interferase RelE/StbE